YMEMSQLDFFIRVVEEGSFSRAADKVYRTQPAVSIAIKRLEQEVGSPLFDRSQKTPALTEVGEVVYSYAQRILSLRHQARQAVGELRELKRGRVRIGANESTSLYLLPQVILSYRQSYPDVKVEIYRHPSDLLPHELLERNIDLALLAYEPNDRDIESFPVLEDELVLIMSPEHRLTRQNGKSPIKVEELGSEQFIAHNVRTASRTKVVELFAKYSTPLNISLEMATVETIKRFVQLKIGLAFVPRMCVSDELARGVLATAPVEGLNYHRTLWAAHHRNPTFSHATAAFLQILREHTKLAHVARS
ncbi:MAG: LysR substrate-binding domain-containing protein, partial [Pyrinomonadaceae bacterium]